MKYSAKACALDEILPLRDLYRGEMRCQILHDSFHARPGWTQPYLLATHDRPVGYGSILIGGPWKGTPTVFEFFILPPSRNRVFALFSALLEISGATAIRAQTSDPTLLAMLHWKCGDVRSEKIVFASGIETALPDKGAKFRRIDANDPSIFRHECEPVGDYGLEIGGEIAATGGLLGHYNPPYHDLFMEVSAKHRRQGLGSYLVQELKRTCREAGGIPCARCNPDNIASIRTLQKAGLIPVAHLLSGTIQAKTPS